MIANYYKDNCNNTTTNVYTVHAFYFCDFNILKNKYIFRILENSKRGGRGCVHYGFIITWFHQ